MPQQAKIEADTGNVIVTVLAPLPEKDDLPHCSVQWGIAGNVNGIYSLTYPISFTQSAYGVYCSENAAQDWGDGVAICGADTIRGTAGHVNLYTKWVNPGGNIALGGESIAWIAIGK